MPHSPSPAPIPLLSLHHTHRHSIIEEGEGVEEVGVMSMQHGAQVPRRYARLGRHCCRIQSLARAVGGRV